MFLTILIFIAILAILVLSHEFGHFIVAKRAGMRVEEFGFGFPPRLFGFKKGETLYSINLFPVGGFVKIFGEDGGERQDPKSFSSNSVFRRSLVIVAGVVMNIILAYALFSAGHMLGTPTIVDSDEQRANVSDIAVYIVAVNTDSPAAEGGLKAGDKIRVLEAEGEQLSVTSVSGVQEFIEANKGKEIVFTVTRGSQLIEIKVYAREEAPEGEGLTGIALERAGILRQPPHVALWEGAKTTLWATQATMIGFGRVFQSAITTGSLPDDISGPIGIAYMTGAVKELGIAYMVQFIAIISLNLAIINIFPFPALDGGRLMFLIAEKIKGSPVSKKVEGMTHAAGFALLIIFIIFVTFKDVGRIF
ncbi:MAG: site-2 protease family protein [Candidatus Spechtbacteria bacterium]|nr:site-2 protease family protein [Candidatus Spechtbacteria bacterium]